MQNHAMLKEEKEQERNMVPKYGLKNQDAITRSLLRVWANMMKRCYNAKAKDYKRYGARGIEVCERWHEARNFVEDMNEGYKKGLQVDRIDNTGPYAKENCRWTTSKINNRNKTNNVPLTFQGKTLILTEWAEIVGLPVGTLWRRIKTRGWTVEKALTTPLRNTGPVSGTSKRPQFRHP